MKARIYLAGPLGFTESGKHYHDEVLRPAVEAAGFGTLDPWPAAEARLADPTVQGLEGDALLAALATANNLVGADNEAMIREADALLAVLDGADVDSGTAAEIGFAAALQKPVVGIRSDLRMRADNPATAINLQVAYFIDQAGGTVTHGLEEALHLLGCLFGGDVANIHPDDPSAHEQ